LEELHPPQEFPPDKLLTDPESLAVRASNLEIARFDNVAHSGHLPSSSDFEIVRINSNLVVHLGQIYSYMGISKPHSKFI
jgi:hypothetical protein